LSGVELTPVAEIQSAKLQPSATESGAAVFKVDYFRRPAYLAQVWVLFQYLPSPKHSQFPQSPQLAKQMCIAGDMGRVYELGPVFRAENSNTHRHLTEYTGLDLEMEIDNHYHEVMNTLDQLFLHIFKGLYRDFRDEVTPYFRYRVSKFAETPVDRHS
jgi:aspartyl/asparaginyl-tRNA synthetase